MRLVYLFLWVESMYCTDSFPNGCFTCRISQCLSYIIKNTNSLIRCIDFRKTTTCFNTIICALVLTLWNSLSRNSVTVSRWTARRYFHCLRRTITRITDKMTVKCVTTIPGKLHRSRRFINQYFRLTDQNATTVYSEPCHVLRGEKCPDASRMFALKYHVRRDLNIDVSVFDWHARIRHATRWRLAVAKGLRENCRDVGRAPARKVHTVICHRSSQHYLKSGGPTYI